MISVALPASFSRIASSTAISSKGFIDILTLASSTPEPSALTRILMSLSTTRFTGTTIFMFLVSSSGHFAPESGPGIGAPHPNSRLIRGQRCVGDLRRNAGFRRGHGFLDRGAVLDVGPAQQEHPVVGAELRCRAACRGWRASPWSGCRRDRPSACRGPCRGRGSGRRPPRALVASNTSGCADCRQTMPASFG